MSALERLFLVCMTTVVMLFAPATAWADDEHPKEGIDYFKVGGAERKLLILSPSRRRQCLQHQSLQELGHRHRQLS